MELRQYARLFIKWLWLIILCAAAGAGGAYYASKETTPSYQATSVLLIQPSSPITSLNTNDVMTSQRLASTYSQLMLQPPVVNETARRLGFSGLGDLDRLGVKISVNPLNDTQLMMLTVQSTDPKLAADIANALPQVFSEQNQAYQRSRYAQAHSDLEAERSKVESDIATTQYSIDQLQANNVLTTEQRVQLARLQNTLRQYEATYATLLNSLEQLRLTEAQTADNIVVTTPADVPTLPIGPRTTSNTLFGLMAGAVVALGIAFLLEYLDDTIHTPDQAQATLGVPALGAILRLSGERPEDNLVTLDAQPGPVVEGYRALRANIQFSSIDHPLRAILVTSASPREGKSTTASNLAISMAQAEQPVILIDTDLRRPVIHHYFNLSNNVGVTTALLHENGETLNGVLQATQVKNLQILTSGPLPPNPSELLSSQRMRHLVDALRATNSILVFDSPPGLAASDAAVLSTLVDGALIVVSADTTRRDEALRTLENLRRVGGNVLGSVVNKLSERSNGYYSYYYYHYYGNAGDASRTQRSPQPRSGWRRLLPGEPRRKLPQVEP